MISENVCKFVLILLGHHSVYVLSFITGQLKYDVLDAFHIVSNSL